MIDASVSGSTIPAEKGELVLLVGGDRELYERRANLTGHDLPAQFALRLMHKDFGLIEELARSCGAVMPTTAVAAALNPAENAKHREEDFSAVAALVQELSGQRDGDGR